MSLLRHLCCLLCLTFLPVAARHTIPYFLPSFKIPYRIMLKFTPLCLLPEIQETNFMSFWMSTKMVLNCKRPISNDRQYLEYYNSIFTNIIADFVSDVSASQDKTKTLRLCFSALLRVTAQHNFILFVHVWWFLSSCSPILPILASDVIVYCNYLDPNVTFSFTNWEKGSSPLL